MRYLSPNRNHDFEQTLLADKDLLSKEWHDYITDRIQSFSDDPMYSRFLDPLAADGTAVRKPISWQGFPRAFDGVLNVLGSTDPVERKKRFERAHRSAENLYAFTYIFLNGDYVQRPYDAKHGIAFYPGSGGKPDVSKAFALYQRPQDEYLEWFPVRDPASGHITRIDFTSEAPEYWGHIADRDPKLLVKLYSNIFNIDIPAADLYFSTDIFVPSVSKHGGKFSIDGYQLAFKKGDYNPYNKWNTKNGAVHLTQRANSLGAEIRLAADATILWPARTNIDADVDRFQLIGNAGYGGINRNSDPTIGYEVNSLALSGYKVTISNPIGLYIGEINLDKFRDPDGHPVSQDKILTIQRGTLADEDGLARVLRFSVHLPTGANYGLESCTFDGFSLDVGGPIARDTTVVIHGIAMTAAGAQPAGQAQGKACKHPSFQPDFYAVVAPAEPCPLPANSVWEAQLEAPVAPVQPIQIGVAVNLPTNVRSSLMNGRR